VDKIRAFYNHPFFIETNVDTVRAALENIPESHRSSAAMVFTAHSIPQSMAQNCEYENQIGESGRLIAESLGHGRWRLAFQSRSGQPTDPWLGPDILVCLRELRKSGATDVIIAPIGFVSDHMEIVYDIDVEAKQLCDEIGLNMQRAATAGTHPLFIKMIRELVLERLDANAARRFVGDYGPSADFCDAGCCLS
jgi:ferrochelatase